MLWAKGGAIDRELRIATRCPVEIIYQGRRLVAESEDLSKRGSFVRSSDRLEVGTVVDLRITIPLVAQIVIRARVAHVLSTSEAKALGRSPGLGFEFVSQDSAGRQQLIDYIDSLIEETTPPAEELLHTVRLIVADPSTPLLVRLTNALEGVSGFEVDSVTNGADALVTGLQREPDALLAAADMPFMSGLELLGKVREHERLSDVPFLLMVERGDDMTRLEGFRRGATDVIEKPFTDEEIEIRLKRITLPKREIAAVPNLRGTLGEISLATLLSLFEFERKSGILTVLCGEEISRVQIQGGRVVAVNGPDNRSIPKERLYQVLDWTHGNFEFTVSEVISMDEVQMSTQELLLEHARITDETSELELIEEDELKELVDDTGDMIRRGLRYS